MQSKSKKPSPNSEPGGSRRVSKKIIIIAGPNGAGKTTFARSFLPEEAQCPRFINADLIRLRLIEVRLEERLIEVRPRGAHRSPRGVYRNSENVIDKARLACFNSGQRVDDHFVDITEMSENLPAAEGIKKLESTKRNRLDDGET
jgi:hypothetical protein